MISIVTSLASSNESLNIYDIQKSSLSCIPDTNEVLTMLSYLTSFGKISETTKGWIRIYENDEKPLRPKRFFYLKDIYNVLSELTEEKPLNSVRIAENIDIDVSQVREYLEFLVTITSTGNIKLENNGYPPSYYIEQFN
ncbi:MAG: hypothetical protein HeimC3_01180 [Candidatus Heimdallarchaeota archaeon LC_3]|nr:MAG: hypothetical protein HeimC3_48920 [Candidatus Heimdallarchaeota archaeon LC_3]OLS27955.1 MAG: hypothetical protein HeimC3_01180 [Candidatus Heimdallarchaeota archaeon LC_3]